MASALDLVLRFTALDRLTGAMGGMTRGLTRTRTAVGATTRELADLQRMQDRIARYKGLDASLTARSRKLADASAKTIRLRDALASTTAPTAKMAAAVARAAQAEARLSQGLERETSRLTSLRRELTAAGIDTNRLAQHEQTLATNTEAANRRLAEQQRRLERVAANAQRAEAIGNAGQRLTTVGTQLIIPGIAIGAPLKIAVEDAADFRASMTDIALKSDLTGEAADAMGRRLEALAPKVAQLPEALQAGVDLLVGKGMNVGDAEQMVGEIGKGASAAKADLRELSEASYAAYGNLKVTAREIPTALDAMYVAGNRGAVELKDMAKLMPVLGASASALGQRGVPAVADLAAALQIAEKGTGNADTAANNLNNLLLKINAQDTVKNFKKFGVDLPKALKKAYREGKSPLEAIADLTDKAVGGDLSRLSYIFGDAEAQGAVRSLIQNRSEYASIKKDSLAGKGTIDRDYQRRDDGGEFVNVKYEAQLVRLKNLAGNVLLPTMNYLIERLGVLTGAVAEWAAAHPEAAGWIAKAAATVALLSIGMGAMSAVFGPLISGFGWILGALPKIVPFLMKLAPALRFIGAAFNIVTGAIRMMAIAAMANPILAAVAAIAVAGYLIYTNWDTVKTFFVGMWAEIVAGFNGGIGGISRTIANFSPLGLFYSAFTGVMSWFGVTLPGTFTGFGAMLVRGLWSGITSRLAALKSGIIGVAASVASWFKNAMGIKSPSRLFMGFGGFMTEGLAIGIHRGAAEPLDRVRTLASDIASAGAPRLLRNAATIAGAVVAGAGLPTVAAAAPTTAATGAAASAGAPVHYHTHHNSYTITLSGGGDVRAQAREMMAEIRKLQATERASSYQDD